VDSVIFVAMWTVLLLQECGQCCCSNVDSVVVAAMWTCTVGVGIQALQRIKSFNFYDGSQVESNAFFVV
jgi:hypothetical protein